MTADATFEARLASKVERSATGCLIFVGCRGRRGYGLIQFHGRAQVAHRAAYIHAHGPIPEGMQLDHLCRTTSCVELTHLEVVTPLVNRHRRADYERDTCARGHPYTGHFGNHGERICLPCRRASARRSRERDRAARSETKP